MPRLSEVPVHEHLGATVHRLRRMEIPAAMVVPKPPVRVRAKIAKRRVIDGFDRLFNVAGTFAVVGIVGYVILPAVVTIATRWQW